MIYGYPGAIQQGNPYGMGGGMSQFAPPMPPMMSGTGYGAQMPNGANTVGEVEAQRRRLKDLGLDDTMIDDALKFKSGLYEQRDQMKQDFRESLFGSPKDEKNPEGKPGLIYQTGNAALSGMKDTGAGMAAIAKDAGAGIVRYGKSL
jgi:hypothetical protein